MSEQSMEVVVHKAALQLKAGESVSVFTQNLTDAGRSYLKQKLNLQKGDACYAMETFADKVVFNTYKYENPPSQDKYYAVKYSRKPDGSFEFGEAVEVQRVTTYEAKNNTFTVTKSKDGDDEAPPGWATVKKSMWGNLL